MNVPLKRMAAIEKRLDAIEKFVAQAGRDKSDEEASPTVFCSYCDKNQYEVRKLIAGHGGAFICDECVLVCVGMCMAAAPVTTKEAVKA